MGLDRSVRKCVRSDVIHKVMKKRAATNPLHVIDSTNMSQINVSRWETEEKELLSYVPDENTSIEEAVGGHCFAEEQFEGQKVLECRLHQVRNVAEGDLVGNIWNI